MSATAPRRGPGFFRVIRFDRTVRGSEQAVRYVAFRSRDLAGKERRIFDDRSDQADVKRFVRDLHDPVTQHRQVAKAYHTVFSLRRADFDRAHMHDWRTVVRDIMRTYELQTGRRLQWIAAEHMHETHPHCHVVIKATYRTQSGLTRRLRLDRHEVQRIKEITDGVLRDRGLVRTPVPERTPPGPTPDRGLSIAAGILGWIQRQIAADRQRRQREDDAARQRWLRGDDREGR